MDYSIIVVAPERARSAAKWPQHFSFKASLPKAFGVLHHWISANDDRLTYRLCVTLFVVGVAMAKLGVCHG